MQIQCHLLRSFFARPFFYLLLWNNEIDIYAHGYAVIGCLPFFMLHSAYSFGLSVCANMLHLALQPIKSTQSVKGKIYILALNIPYTAFKHQREMLIYCYVKRRFDFFVMFKAFNISLLVGGRGCF